MTPASGLDDTTERYLDDLCEQARPPMPRRVRPVVIAGCGGIVKDAHLPAYRMAGIPVAAFVDREMERARAVQAIQGSGLATDSVEEAIRYAPPESVFDVAVPAAKTLDVLPLLPDGAAVLIQKPMGETLAEAEAILSLCRRKRLVAAINFQLRWAPVMLATSLLMKAGVLGRVHDMEVQVSVHMPWELWSFLRTAPRLEILYHSIHYVDLVRAFLGEPQGVYAKTVRSPRTPELAATKSTIVFDYGEWTRAYIATNHSHDFGREWQRSYVQLEGEKAALRAQMGVNLNYPEGEPDTLTYLPRGGKARILPTRGNWFPDAFVGSMGSLQAYVDGVTNELPTGVENAIHTMRAVEAAYLSSERGGEPLPELKDGSEERK
ncbi:MAG TPA: Gfo/Idh/MocA family oxidoreductase [Bryobacteraceae bacterium]|nr:Gfo/Idh/MocA family oxidoreductase [Bryobacteraceae bacterium]